MTPTAVLAIALAKRPECADDDGSWCSIVYGRTHNAWLARSSDWLVVRPGKILLILLVGLIARTLLHRVIARLAHRAGQASVPGVLAGTRASAFLESPLSSERRAQRAATMGTVLKSVVTGVVATVVALMVLAELGIDIAPLLASAGIVGVALGFGAQTLVKDFISGVFMILEDQYGVGDVVDLGPVTGTVESVGLRVTRLRAVDGAVWYVRNGEVARVANKSQGWARVVLDVQIAPDADVDVAREVLLTTATALHEDPEWAELVLEEPAVWGVEAISGDAVVVRLVMKVDPATKDDVARELRARLLHALDEAGVALPLPQRGIWLQSEPAPAPAATPAGD